MRDLDDFARRLDEASKQERDQIEEERRQRERIESEQREKENRIRRVARELRNQVILPRLKSVASRIASTYAVSPGIEDNEYRCDCSAVLPRGKVTISVLAAIQPGDDVLRLTAKSAFSGQAKGTRQKEQRPLHSGAQTFRSEAASGQEVAEWVEAELTKCLRACIRALEG